MSIKRLMLMRRYTEGMAVVGETLDPRIVRTRRMLMDALVQLLEKKDFDDISVQEIADEATLNRATFYLHFPDKNALLQAMTAMRFRQLTEMRGLSFANCDNGLRAIALGVCDYLEKTTKCPGQLTKMPIERSLVPVVEGIFWEGSKRHPLAPGVDGNVLASTAAWAIYGAAHRWFQTENRVPAEEMAAQIEVLVKPILIAASAE